MKRLLVVFNVAVLLLFLVTAMRSLWSEAPQHSEGIILGLIESIRLGRVYQLDALYSPPYSLLTHPPLSYGLGYLFSLMGPRQFWPLRLCVLLSTCAVSFVIAVWIKRKTNSSLIAIFSGVLFLFFPPILYWARLTRCPDQLQVFFTLCSLLIYEEKLKGDRTPRKGWPILLGLTAFLAVFSKQTALPILWGTILWDRAMCKSLRKGWVEILVFSGMTGVGFLGLEIYSHGGFHRNILAHLLLSWDLELIYTYGIRQSGVVWILGILFGSLSRNRNPLFLRYFVVALITGFLTSFKEGSSVIHFADACAAVALLGGQAAGHGLGTISWNQLGARSVLVTLALCYMGYKDINICRFTSSGSFPELLNNVKKLPGPVLSEDAGLLLKLGQEQYWDDPFMLRPFLEKDIGFQRLISEGYFKVFVGYRGRLGYFPPSIASLVHERFQKIREIARYEVWVLKPPMGRPSKEGAG